jgi:hypothetical protein|nr:MAG TPA: hypothetical protein [Caudoviricetes sp.]
MTKNNDLEAKKRKDSLLEEQKKADFEWLMSEKRGRRIVRHLLEDAGIWRSTFHESQSISAFNEGRRNMGLKLLSNVQPTSNFHLILTEEGNNEY